MIHALMRQFYIELVVNLIFIVICSENHFWSLKVKCLENQRFLYQMMNYGKDKIL
jgi:hypothetical protein